jgi:hypothetical protein
MKGPKSWEVLLLFCSGIGIGAFAGFAVGNGDRPVSKSVVILCTVGLSACIIVASQVMRIWGQRRGV